MRKHLGGVAVAGDLAGLDPDPPGEPEEHESAHEIDEPAQQQTAPVAEHHVDEVERDVLVRPRGERQSGEDQRQQQQLGDLEGAAQRPVEDVAADDVGRRQSHQAEQQNSRGGAQHAIEPDARLGGL